MKLPTANQVAASAGCFVVACLCGIIPFVVASNPRAMHGPLEVWSGIALICISMPAFFGIAGGLVFGRIIGVFVGAGIAAWVVHICDWSTVPRFW